MGRNAPYCLLYAATGSITRLSSSGTIRSFESLKTAIESASSGDVVFIPPGTWNVTSSITVPSGISVIGAGWQHSRVAGDVDVSNGVFYCIGAEYYFEGISVINSNLGTAVAGQDSKAFSIGLGGESPTNATFIDCEIVGNDDCLYIGNGNQVRVIDCYASNIPYDWLYVVCFDLVVERCIWRGEYSFDENSGGQKVETNVMVMGAPASGTSQARFKQCCALMTRPTDNGKSAFFHLGINLGTCRLDVSDCFLRVDGNNNDETYGISTVGTQSAATWDVNIIRTQMRISSSGTSATIGNRSGETNTYNFYDSDLASVADIGNSIVNSPLRKAGSTLGLYGVTPVAQQAKASYDDFSALTDTESFLDTVGAVST